MQNVKGFMNRLALLLAAAAVAAPLRAAEPLPFSYQGTLTDASGAPRNGSFNMAFGVYAGPSDTTALFTDAQSVTVTNGAFSALIGTGTLGGSVNLRQAVSGGTERYLQVTVNGVPLTPRQRIAAGGYALAVAAGSVGTDALADGAVTQAKLQLAAPSSPNQAATKQYVDDHAQGAGTLVRKTLSLSSANSPFTAVDAAGASFVKITGPTSNYVVGGLTGGQDGRMVVLYNSTTRNMVIADASQTVGAASQDQILTGTGTSINTAGEGSVTLIYDGEQGKWIVTALRD